MGCLPLDSYIEIAFWFLLGVLTMAAFITYDTRRPSRDQD